jgi:predicted transcriptional regulator
MKTEEIKKARELRKEKGFSIKEIANTLKVAKSSVSLWVRNIELTKNQIERLEKRIEYNRYNFIIKQAKNKKEKYEKIREIFRKNGFILAKNDFYFQNICCLYWGEGAKSRNTFSISNCDPKMLNFVGRWLIKNKHKITFYVCCHDNSENNKKIKKYWMKNLPFLKLNMFRKITRYKENKGSKKRQLRKQIYGTARITINSTELIQMIYGGIEYLVNMAD